MYFWIIEAFFQQYTRFHSIISAITCPLLCDTHNRFHSFCGTIDTYEKINPTIPQTSTYILIQWWLK